jgi:hypothetical protein
LHIDLGHEFRTLRATRATRSALGVVLLLQGVQPITCDTVLGHECRTLRTTRAMRSALGVVPLSQGV